MVALVVGFGLFASTPSPDLIAVLEQQTEAVPGWPWTRGDARPSENLGGVIGLSLLRAYQARPDSATWMTLVQYAEHLRTSYAPGDRLPFKADIELLAALGDEGLVEDGGTFAAALFERVRRVSPTGHDEYQRIARGRAAVPEIIGYDVALAIRAAIAVGELDYARELADAAIADGHLDLRNPQDAFQVTSVGGLLIALGRLARPQDDPLRAKAAQALIAAQSPAGSWAINDTQATAYAVAGLATVEGGASAARAGRAWLLEHRLKKGAWASYHDGLPEPFVGPVIPLVAAEALGAVLD